MPLRLPCVAALPCCAVQAVSMNDSYLSDEDYSSVQSVEDIKRILSEAQTPGPNKYNFDNQVRACWDLFPAASRPVP
jgi:hypothetical protein